MKISTNSILLRFIGVIALWNILFRFSLSYVLENEFWPLVILPPVIFFLLMYFTGRYFGLKQWNDLPVNKSFTFHVSTFVVFFLVSYGFYFLGLLSQHEPIIGINYTLFFWGIGLLISFFHARNMMKNTIKGLDRDQLFD
jgi:hypothetical protein